MSNKSQHARQHNCSSGLLAYDGGVVNLDTQDIWVLCENPNCEAPGCHGPLAGDPSPDYADFGPKAIRVRNVNDLKKHSAGNDDGYGITCLVTPKMKFSNTRPDPKSFKKGALAKDIRRGSISVAQSTETLKFPTGGRARVWRKKVADMLSSSDIEIDGTRTRRRHILLSNLSRLTAINGIDAVIDAFPECEEGSDILAAVSTANQNLAARRNELRVKGRTNHVADRNAGQPLAQPVKAVHEAKPSRALVSVAPRPGEPVGNQFRVEIKTGHFAFRFLDRGLEKVSAETLEHVARTSRARIKEMEGHVESFISAAVFTHFVDGKKAKSDPNYKVKSVLNEIGRSASTKHQSQVSNCCEVRAPHPRLPDQDLVMILEFDRQVKDGTQTKWVVNPRTCIRVPRNKDFTEEMSYGDTSLSDEQAAVIEKSLQRTIDSRR